MRKAGNARAPVSTSTSSDAFCLGYRYFDPEPSHLNHTQYFRLTFPNDTKEKEFEFDELKYTVNIMQCVYVNELFNLPMGEKDASQTKFYKSVGLTEKDLHEFPLFKSLRTRLTSSVYHFSGLALYGQLNVYALENAFRRHLIADLKNFLVRYKRFLGFIGSWDISQENLDRLLRRVSCIYENSADIPDFNITDILAIIADKPMNADKVLKLVSGSFLKAVADNRKNNTLMLAISDTPCSSGLANLRLSSRQFAAVQNKVLNKEELNKNFAYSVTDPKIFPDLYAPDVPTLKCLTPFLLTNRESGLLKVSLAKTELFDRLSTDITETDYDCYLLGKSWEEKKEPEVNFQEQLKKQREALQKRRAQQGNKKLTPAQQRAKEEEERRKKKKSGSIFSFFRRKKKKNEDDDDSIRNSVN